MHKIHPYANIFPMLSEEELQSLAEDIRQHGQREPIVLSKSQLVLDGRNRLSACKIAEVEPEFVDFKGDDELSFVLSVNLHRRHLTTSQRASVAAKLLPIYEQQADARKKSGKNQHTKSHKENLPDGKNGQSRDKAGAALNVSGKTVDMASKVHKEAIKEVVAALESGDLAVSAAVVIAELPKEKQEELAAGGVKAMRAEASRIKNLPNEINGFGAWLYELTIETNKLIDRVPEKYREELVPQVLNKILDERFSTNE